MVQRTASVLPELYVEDETAWLDAMAELIAAGAYADLDYDNLREFLTDMARRDRKEVRSRLIVLMIHALKWTYQPTQRSRSWHGSILEQQDELRTEAGRGVLRNHAEDVLAEAYHAAVTRAVAESGLPPETFPRDCPYSFDDLLSFAPLSESPTIDPS